MAAAVRGGFGIQKPGCGETRACGPRFPSSQFPSRMRTVFESQGGAILFSAGQMAMAFHPQANFETSRVPILEGPVAECRWRFGQCATCNRARNKIDCSDASLSARKPLDCDEFAFLLP